IDEGHLFLGELALDGSVRPVKGILPIAAAARSFGFEGIFLPGSNAAEAAVVRGIDVFPVESLSQVAAVLNREETITPA
ncbi:magnesium chelatase domain-containing protein, partial [Klebsiella pneumoniae]